MAVPVPVTVSTDFSFGGSLHFYVPIPVPAPPTMMPAVEIPIPQAWPVGVALGSVKKTSSVLVNGRAAIQAGHDCGKIIPQITIPPNNALLPLHLVGSSREIIVKCFSVRMDKLQTACTTIWLPMLSCGNPVSVPLTFTPTNVMRGVFVGASAADFVGAIIQTLARMAIERLFSVGPGWKLPFVREFQKSVLGALAGGLASGVQHLMDPRYPIAVDIKIKAAGLEFGLGVSCGSSDTKNNPSQVTASVTKKWNPGKGEVAGGKASASATYTWDAGGDKAKEGVQTEIGVQGGVGAIGGKASASAEYHPDAPEGQRSKASVGVGVNTAAGSASGTATAEIEPNAPAGKQVKGTVSGKVDTPSGPATATSDPATGSLPSSTAAAPQSPPTPPPTPKGAVWQPPQSGAGVWGPAL